MYGVVRVVERVFVVDFVNVVVDVEVLGVAEVDEVRDCKRVEDCGTAVVSVEVAAALPPPPVQEPELQSP